MFLFLLICGCDWLAPYLNDDPWVDVDQDGWRAGDDCDDKLSWINPGATETAYDRMDNDCDPLTVDQDLDGDGVDYPADCNDDDPLVSPDATETCDGVDANCDGVDGGCIACEESAGVQTADTAACRPLTGRRFGAGQSDGNWVMTFTYDRSGNRTSEAFDEGPADGRVDKVVTYSHNACGELEQEATDRENDGTVESIVTFVYTYDADGTPTRGEMTTDDGTLFVIAPGSSGDNSWTETFTSLDGEDPYSVTKTFDADGNVLTEVREEGLDGTIDQTYTYVYDPC